MGLFVSHRQRQRPRSLSGVSLALSLSTPHSLTWIYHIIVICICIWLWPTIPIDVVALDRKYLFTSVSRPHRTISSYHWKLHSFPSTSPIRRHTLCLWPNPAFRSYPLHLSQSMQQTATVRFNGLDCSTSSFDCRETNTGSEGLSTNTGRAELIEWRSSFVTHSSSSVELSAVAGGNTGPPFPPA